MSQISEKRMRELFHAITTGVVTEKDLEDMTEGDRELYRELQVSRKIWASMSTSALLDEVIDERLVSHGEMPEGQEIAEDKLWLILNKLEHYEGGTAYDRHLSELIEMAVYDRADFRVRRGELERVAREHDTGCTCTILRPARGRRGGR